DAETLGPVLAANPSAALVIPEANWDLVAERLGVDPAWPIGLDDGGGADAGPVRIDALASAHERIERDAQGRCRHLGYVVRVGPWRVYHSGDTVRYAGMAERLREHAPDVALLPINGRDPARGVDGNLDGPEAAALARDAGAGLVVP